MSDALPFPPRPNLEQYKKLANDFQHACQASDPGAIREWATPWIETLARLQGLALALPFLFPRWLFGHRWLSLQLHQN